MVTPMALFGRYSLHRQTFSTRPHSAKRAESLKADKRQSTDLFNSRYRRNYTFTSNIILTRMSAIHTRGSLRDVDIGTNFG